MPRIEGICRLPDGTRVMIEVVSRGSGGEPVACGFGDSHIYSTILSNACTLDVRQGIVGCRHEAVAGSLAAEAHHQVMLPTSATP